MADQYFHQKKLDRGYSFEEYSLKGNEYEECRFSNCDLSNADLSGAVFNDCVFSNCNMSMATLLKTAFRNTHFKECKLLGLHFEDGNPFGLQLCFENCVLNHSSFYQMNLQGTMFKDTSLHEVDFTDADLSKAVFENCDLFKAHFENTNLEAADLRTAAHFQINPVINKIRKAKFAPHNLEGLLTSFDIRVE